MAFSAILNSEIEVGDPITQSLMQKIKDNDDFLNSTIGTLGTFDVLNGSFEIDADSDTVPDSWTKALHPGGSGAIAAVSQHGTNAFKFVVPSGASNGGGTLTSDYIPYGRLDYYDTVWLGVNFWVEGGNAVGVAVKILAYNAALSLVNTATVYTATSGYPTSHDRIYLWQLTATELPSTGVFFRVQLEGGTIGPGVTGNVYFDHCTVRPRVPWNWDESVTFTEQTTTSATYASVATLTFHAPYYMYADEMITFPVEIKNSATNDTWVRAKIGSNYSAEYKIAPDGTNYEACNIQIPNTLAGNLTTSLDIELKTAAGTAYAKKTNAWAQHSLLDYRRP